MYQIVKNKDLFQSFNKAIYGEINNCGYNIIIILLNSIKIYKLKNQVKIKIFLEN